MSIMDLERRITHLNGRRLVMDLPEGFENRKVEVTVAAIDEDRKSVRRPHPTIAGQIKIHDEIFDSASAEDWDVS